MSESHPHSSETGEKLALSRLELIGSRPAPENSEKQRKQRSPSARNRRVQEGVGEGPAGALSDADVLNRPFPGRFARGTLNSPFSALSRPFPALPPVPAGPSKQPGGPVRPWPSQAQGWPAGPSLALPGQDQPGPPSCLEGPAVSGKRAGKGRKRAEKRSPSAGLGAGRPLIVTESEGPGRAVIGPAGAPESARSGRCRKAGPKGPRCPTPTVPAAPQGAAGSLAGWLASRAGPGGGVTCAYSGSRAP